MRKYAYLILLLLSVSSALAAIGRGVAVPGIAAGGNLPVSSFIVNYSASSSVNPFVRIPQPLGDNDIPNGHVLTATVNGAPWTTFTPARLASGQANSPAFVEVMGQLPATIPGSLAISSLTSSAGVATATTGSVHGLTAGVSYVVVNGATQGGYDGVFLVQATPSTTQFTYNLRGFSNASNPASDFTSPAIGSPVMYNAQPVVLNHAAGSWNTTLPAGKTAAQIVSDIQSHMDNVGLVYQNVLTLGQNPANGNSLGSGSWKADANQGFNLGTTPAETGYYRVVATGPSSMDVEVDVPLVDATTYSPSGLIVSGGIATVTVANDLVSNGSVTGSISGTTLTVTGGQPLILALGQTIVTSTGLSAQINEFGSGTGGDGTYTLSANLGTVISGTINLAGQWVHLTGFTPSACNGYSQVVGATSSNFTIVPPPSCTTASINGSMQVLEKALWAEIHETAWLNTSTGVVQAISFKQYVNQGKRLGQNIRANGNLAVTLNGSVVRGWGGFTADGRTFTAISPSSVDTTGHTITIAGNTFVNGQAVTVGCAGGGCTVPAPLVAENTTISSITVNPNACPTGFATATATVSNNLVGNATTQVRISGANPTSLDGVWTLTSASSTNFTFNLPCGPTTVTTPGTVSPFYFVSNSTPGSTIQLHTFQDAGNRPGSAVALSTQGSGTLTVKGNTTVYPYTRNSLTDVDGDWDFDTGTGVLNGKPTVYNVADSAFCIKAWRCQPIDLSVVMVNASDPSPQSWSPDTFAGQDPGINTGGANGSYGTPFNELETRRENSPWDRTGYVQTARVSAEAQGVMAAWMYDTDYRMLVTNASTYVGLNTYTASFRTIGGSATLGTNYSSDFQPAIQDTISGVASWVNSAPGPSHWYRPTLATYIYDGGAPYLNQLLQEASAFALYNTDASWQHPRKAIVTANGHVLYPAADFEEIRAFSPSFDLPVAAALFAPDGSPEKGFFKDTLSDTLEWLSTAAASTTTFNANFANMAYMWWDAAQGGYAANTFSNITSGESNSGVGDTSSSGQVAGMSTAFENSFVTLALAFDYGLWPSATMQTVAMQGERFVNMMDTTWSCQASVGTYAYTFTTVPDWDVAGASGNSYSSPINVGHQAYGAEAAYFNADGSHIVILTNDLLTPQPISGVDRIQFRDADYAGGAPWGPLGATAANGAPAVTTGGSSPGLNTWYYLQNVGTTGTHNNFTATLSTDAAGSTPVTWTGIVNPASTLNGALTAGATSIPINAAVSIRPQVAPLADTLVQIDSELIEVAKGNTQTTLTVRSSPVGGNNPGSQSGRGAFGSTAASHLNGAAVQTYVGMNYVIDFQNRSGGNCPSTLIQGIHSTPVADGVSSTVSQGYFTLPWAASGYYAHYGLKTSAGFNRMNTIMGNENADTCHGLTGFAQCGGGTIQYSATPN